MLTNEFGEARDKLSVDELDIIALDTGFITVSAFAATAEGESLLEATTDIGIRGLISFISLQVTPGSVATRRHGDNPMELLALVKDDVGLGVPGAPVNFNTEAGSLASGGAVISADGNGQARDTLSLTEQDVTLWDPALSMSEQRPLTSLGRPLSGFPGQRCNMVPRSPTFTLVDGLLVDFCNASTGDARCSCSWDFGDGATTQVPANPSTPMEPRPDRYVDRAVIPSATDSTHKTVT